MTQYPTFGPIFFQFPQHQFQSFSGAQLQNSYFFIQPLVQKGRSKIWSIEMYGAAFTNNFDQMIASLEDLNIVMYQSEC